MGPTPDGERFTTDSLFVARDVECRRQPALPLVDTFQQVGVLLRRRVGHTESLDESPDVGSIFPTQCDHSRALSRGVSRTHSTSSLHPSAHLGVGSPASTNSWLTSAATSAVHRSPTVEGG